MARIIALLYGFAAYAAFFAAIVYLVGFLTDAAVPKSIDSGPETPTSLAVLVDVVLVSLFALQHSVMARPRFKRWWTRYVPSPVERSTYVLFASLVLLLLFWQWRPIPAVVWQVENPQIATAIVAISFTGWLIVLASTFLINHFELFGLDQVFGNLVGRPMPAPCFRAPLLYGFVRHPLYLGFIIALWAAPRMTAGHLLLAALMTIYIVAAIQLEERDLIEVFGDEYRRYQKRVSMLVPWRRPA